MEDFVSYDIAVKLKEKGFPQYISDDEYITENEYDDDKYLVGERWGIPFIPDYCNVVAAPTISQVLKWLREEKKLNVNMRLYIEDKWYYTIQNNKGDFIYSHLVGSDFLHESYEESALAGIEYALDNLL